MVKIGSVDPEFCLIRGLFKKIKKLMQANDTIRYDTIQ